MPKHYTSLSSYEYMRCLVPFRKTGSDQFSKRMGLQGLNRSEVILSCGAVKRVHCQTARIMARAVSRGLLAKADYSLTRAFETVNYTGD